MNICLVKAREIEVYQLEYHGVLVHREAEKTFVRSIFPGQSMFRQTLWSAF